MATKPFGSINTADKYKLSGTWQTFAYLDENLKAYITPEANGIPVKQIMLLDGWSIDANGNLTPADVASQVKNYALVCTGTPAATATFAYGGYGVALEGLFPAMLFKIRINAMITAETMIYRRATSTNVTRWAFGIDPDMGFFVDIGGDGKKYAGSWTEFQNSGLWGEWIDCGFMIDLENSNLYFLLCGRSSITPQAIVLTSMPLDTSDIVQLGAEGIDIALCALTESDLSIPFPINTNGIPPFPRIRPAAAVNYYDCRPGVTATLLYDRALANVKKIDLTITNGAIEEVEMI